MRRVLDAIARPFNKDEQTRIAFHSHVMEPYRKVRKERLVDGVPVLPRVLVASPRALG
jgi:hypothetical protein